MPEHNIDHIAPEIEAQAEFIRRLSQVHHTSVPDWAPPDLGPAVRFNLCPGDDTTYNLLLARVHRDAWVTLLNHGGPNTWELPDHLTANPSTPVTPTEVRHGLHQDPYISTVLAHFLTHLYRTPR